MSMVNPICAFQRQVERDSQDFHTVSSLWRECLPKHNFHSQQSDERVFSCLDLHSMSSDEHSICIRKCGHCNLKMIGKILFDPRVLYDRNS
jgi:hypothetical protein